MSRARIKPVRAWTLKQHCGLCAWAKPTKADVIRYCAESWPIFPISESDVVEVELHEIRPDVPRRHAKKKRKAK